MKSKEWLLYNAVLTWLHHYGDSDSDLIEQYKLLEEELKQVHEQSNNSPVQKRGRPAKRARKKEASSNEASKEKVTEPKEQT